MDLAENCQKLRALRAAKLEQILKQRTAYFRLASKHVISKAALEKVLEELKNQSLKTTTIYLINFCVEFQGSAFQDFQNMNLSLFEFQKTVEKTGQAQLVWMEQISQGLKIEFEANQSRIHALEEERIKSYERIEIFQKQIRGIKSLDRCPFQGYGYQMERLCGLIKDFKGFILTPQGPLGNCFTVRLPNWTGLVEHILKPFLYLFLVDNQEDAVKLQGLIDEVYGAYALTMPDAPMRPNVWVTKFTAQALDISGSKVQGETAPTLLDILSFEEEATGMNTVRNFLLKYGRIEKTLLFNTQHEAFPILAEIDMLPKNCLLAYTLDAFKIKPAPAFRTKSLGLTSYRAKIVKPLTPKLSSVLKKLSRLEAEVEHGVDFYLKQRKRTRLELARELEILQLEHLNLKTALSPKVFKNLNFVLDENPTLRTTDFENGEGSNNYVKNLLKTETAQLKKLQKHGESLDETLRASEITLEKLWTGLTRNFRNVHGIGRGRTYSN